MMPHAQQPTPSKKGRGCVIALSIAMGTLGLILAAIVIALVMFARSDAGKTTFKVIDDGTKLTAKGLKAPGAAELRALGCQQAMIVELKDFATVLEDLDGGDLSGMPNELIVVCQVAMFSPPPTCDRVASTYVDAVGRASAKFVVTVTRQGGGKSECEVQYDEVGNSLGPMKAPTTTRRR